MGMFRDAAPLRRSRRPQPPRTPGLGLPPKGLEAATAGPPPLPLEGTALVPPVGANHAAFIGALFLVFVTFSRVVEYPGLRSLSLAIVAFIVGIICIPLGGALRTAIQDRLFLCLLVLTGFMLLALPFGIFRSGSLNILQQYWSRSLIVCLAISSSVCLFSQFRKIILCFAFAILALSTYSFLLGSEDQGRINMASGFFSNPNDLAAILMMALPVIIGASRLAAPMMKFPLLAATLVLWMTFLRTGSRGGFIAMVIVLGLLFLHATAFRKMQMVVVSAFLIIAASVYVPSATLKRFVVFTDSIRFADFDADEKDAYTESSTDSRLEMASQGLSLTLEHPLFGVGAGNFRVATSAKYKERGQYAPWTDVHNTYLQISSENGIPTLIVYVILIASLVRRLNRIYRTYRHSPIQENQFIAESAWYLRTAVLSFIASGMFGNYAYQYHLPLLVGLTIALSTAESNRPAAIRAATQPNSLAPRLQRAVFPPPSPLHPAAPASVRTFR